jgi:AraC-like DNA-binding protein
MELTKPVAPQPVSVTQKRLFSQYLGVGLIQPGAGRWHGEGVMVVEKIAPATIIAKACVGRYEVRNGKRRGIAEPGDLFLAAKGDPLWIGHHFDKKKDNAMEAKWLHAHFTLCGVIDVVTLLDLPLIVRGEQAKTLGNIVEELIDARRHPELGLMGAARKHELVFGALRMLCTVAPLRPEAEASIDSLQRLAGVFDFIDQHLAEDLSVADLARLVHLSPPRFFAVFKAHAGVSPKAFVSQARLTRASHMLIGTDMAVAEVGRSVGFRDPFHFSRAFRAKFGQAPLGYRQRYRAGNV